MTALQGTPSHTVLRNRGIPVLVHRVVPNDDQTRWTRVLNDETDEFVYETVYVKFTNLTLADIEAEWDGIEGWENALEARPKSTILTTLAFAWEVPLRCAGMMMLDAEDGDYAAAIGAAYLQANGAEGDVVVRALVQGAGSWQRQREAIQTEALRAVQEAESDQTNSPEPVSDAPAIPTSPSPSPDGYPDSEGGSNLVEVLTSSGT